MIKTQRTSRHNTVVYFESDKFAFEIIFSNRIIRIFENIIISNTAPPKYSYMNDISFNNLEQIKTLLNEKYYKLMIVQMHIHINQYLIGKPQILCKDLNYEFFVIKPNDILIGIRSLMNDDDIEIISINQLDNFKHRLTEENYINLQQEVFELL